MKALSLILALTSFRAFACPDLAGEFAVCRSKNNVSIEGVDMIVRNTMNEGVRHYTFDFLPDGYTERSKERYEVSRFPARKEWVSETGVNFVSVVSTKCVGNKLYLDSVITSDGANWKSDVTVIRKSGNTLIMDSKGTVGRMAFTDTLTCR